MTRNRTLWRRRHAHALWKVDAPDFNNQEWRKHFRMSRDTFEYIAKQLRPHLEKRSPKGQPRTIHYKKRLAIVLWWLATPTEYRSLATLFGMGISTLCNLTREVCHAIKETLFHRCISLPSGHRLQETIDGFERRGFPQWWIPAGVQNTGMHPSKFWPTMFFFSSSFVSEYLKRFRYH